MSLTQLDDNNQYDSWEPLPIPKSLRKEYELVDGQIYDRVGKYYLSNGLWNRYLIEGRRFKFRHSFELIQHLEEEGIPVEDSCNLVICTRCGEDRKAWVGVTMHELNKDGFCTPPTGYTIDKNYNVVATSKIKRIINRILN